jgi:hypothetical protein
VLPTVFEPSPFPSPGLGLPTAGIGTLSAAAIAGLPLTYKGAGETGNPVFSKKMPPFPQRFLRGVENGHYTRQTTDHWSPFFCPGTANPVSPGFPRKRWRPDSRFFRFKQNKPPPKQLTKGVGGSQRGLPSPRITRCNFWSLGNGV